jgi:hypothetical protein
MKIELTTLMLSLLATLNFSGLAQDNATIKKDIEELRNRVRSLEDEVARIKAAKEHESLGQKLKKEIPDPVTTTVRPTLGETKTAIDDQKYFPDLRDGLERRYSVEYVIALAGSRKGVFVFRVDGKVTINGKSYFKDILVPSGIPGAEPEVTYIRRAKDGLYAIDEKDATKTEYLQTPFPLSLGMEWTVKTSEKTSRYKVETIDTLQLIDRKYDKCLKISYREGQIEGTSYYAPGIGEVRGVGKGPGFTMDYTLEER